MIKQKKIFLGYLFVLVVFGFLVNGCATGKAEKASAKKGEARYTVKTCPSAKVTKVSYMIKKYKGSPRFHVTVGIENVSSEPKRFRLHIFLPGGISSGGLYPRKGKPPVIQPGKELVQTYPMYYSKIPESFELVVTELPLK